MIAQPFVSDPVIADKVSDGAPEGAAVVFVRQMCQLMDDDIIDDVLRQEGDAP
jgi:hypothetical protein